MWEQTTWWLVGGTALVVAAVSILGRRSNVLVLFVGDALAMLLWWLFAINAFAVEQTTETGGAVVHEYPSLGYLAFILGFIMALDLLAAVFQAAGIDLKEMVSNAT